MSPIERSTKVRSVTVTERPLPRWQEPSDEKDLLKRLAANTDGLSALALNKDETAYKIGSDLRWMREQIREPILARLGTKTQANTAFRKWQEEHVKIGSPSTARRMMKFSERCDKAEPPQLLEYEPGKAYHDKVKKETPPEVLAARAAKKEAQRAVTTAKQGLRAMERYVATSPSEFGKKQVEDSRRIVAAAEKNLVDVESENAITLDAGKSHSEDPILGLKMVVARVVKGFESQPPERQKFALEAINGCIADLQALKSGRRVA